MLLLAKASLCQPEPSREQAILLQVVAGINATFEHCREAIWPGYDLSRQPYLAYMPGDFVLLVNGAHAPAGFDDYPPRWPDLGCKVWIHYGKYRELVGQFAFNFQIDSVTTFAMGLPKDLILSFDKPAYMLFRTTIHEGFHQYQFNHFGEIPWAREELYPILDVENTALASLEMHILTKVLEAMFHRNRAEVQTLVEEFVAVREQRWKRGNGFVRKYEQGQEINEGTARYVEMKAVECFLKLDTTRIANDLLKALRRSVGSTSIHQVLLDDLNARLSGMAVAPEDMLRNRIYPVGAALGFLLDYLDIPWKMQFQSAGSEISFSKLLEDGLDIDPRRLSGMFTRAQQAFDYTKIKLAARRLIDAYFQEYRQALARFNHQEGIRVEIELSSSGLQRFRSSRSKTWVVDQGKNILCQHYNLYSLKSPKGKSISLEIRDRAVFEHNEWDSKAKKVVFYTDDISKFKLDGLPYELREVSQKKFNQLELIGAGFRVKFFQSGDLIHQGNRIVIKL